MPATLTRRRTKTHRRFAERSTWASVADRIDAEAGIIQGVKILGAHSQNGREYTRQAMRAAIQLYENSKVFWFFARIGG